MGPVEELMLRAWGHGIRIDAGDRGDPTGHAIGLASCLDEARKLDADRTMLREALDAYLRGHTSDERRDALDRPCNGSPFSLGVRAMYHSGVRVDAESKKGA